jgi:hypothetical protein
MLPVIPVVADKDKRVRASRVEPLVESGWVYLPESAPWLDDFKSELLAFPAVQNDDQVDAFVYALTRLREDSDFNRNYLNWLSTTSPNAQKLQGETGKSPETSAKPIRRSTVNLGRTARESPKAYMRHAARP